MDHPTQNEALFSDLKGHFFAKKFLSSVLNKNKINNAYLFSGPSGIGKKLAVLRFLEGLLNDGEVSMRERERLKQCNHPDLLWIEPTYNLNGKIIPRSKSKEEGFNAKNPAKIRLQQILI